MVGRVAVVLVFPAARAAGAADQAADRITLAGQEVPQITEGAVGPHRSGLLGRVQHRQRMGPSEELVQPSVQLAGVELTQECLEPCARDADVDALPGGAIDIEDDEMPGDHPRGDGQSRPSTLGQRLAEGLIMGRDRSVLTGH